MTTTQTMQLETLLHDMMAQPEGATLLQQAVEELPKPSQRMLAKAVSEATLVGPDQTTSNRIWTLIVRSFAGVMFISVVVLGVSVFMAPVSDGTKPETMLTVFTTVTAFLAGLFAPSPTQSKTT